MVEQVTINPTEVRGYGNIVNVKSDDEIGMYDVINDVFYTNSGSGTFTKGADI